MPCAAKLAPTTPEHPARSDRDSPPSRSGAKRLSVVVGFAALATLLSMGAGMGAAASQGTSTSGFGAETKVVSSCGTGMRFAYTTSYDSGIRGYAIDGIVVSDIPAACLDRNLAATFYDGKANYTAVGSTVTATLPSSGTTDLIPIVPRSNTVDASVVSGVSVTIA